jgi:hypothetical protein
MKKYKQPIYVCNDKLLNKMLTFGSVKALAEYLNWPYYTCYFRVKNGQYTDEYYSINKTELNRYEKK